MRKLKKIWNKHNKKRKIAIIIIGILDLLLIIFAIIRLFNINEDDKKVIIEKENFIYDNGTLKLLDEKGKIIGNYQCKNKNQNNCFVAYETNDDNFDTDKNVYENNKNIKQRSKIYNNRFVFISDNAEGKNENIKLYDIKKKEILETYYSIKSYNDKNNFIVVSDKNNKYNLITLDKKINNILKNNYDYIGKILDNSDMTIVKTNKTYEILDENNNSIFSTNEEIKYFDKNSIVIKDDNGYKVLNYNNEILLEKSKFITLKNNYIIYINDEKLNIMDIDKNSIIPESLELKNNNYIPKYIFTKELKQRSVKRAFDLDQDNENLTITIFEENNKHLYKYNLNDIKNNKELVYYSYYDGRLYFYSDLQKTKLSGIYNCTNKSLNKCYIAKDASNTDLSTPIFSNRFVFVYDSASNGNGDIKVNLIDLKTNKKLGNYIEVTTNSSQYENNKTNTFIVNDIAYVSAKNKNSKIGMLKIIKGSVTKNVSFDYDDLEIINSNYIKGIKDNKNVLLDFSGNDLKDFYSKTYYVIKNNNSNYEIYNFENNNKVIDGSFAYVKFYQDYLAAVNQANVLYIYNYNAQKLIDGIGVTNNKDFTIKVSSDTATITTSLQTLIYNTKTIPWTQEIEKTAEE